MKRSVCLFAFVACLMFVLSSIPVKAEWIIADSEVWNGPIGEGGHVTISIQARVNDIIIAGGSSPDKLDYYLLTSYQYQDYISMLNEFSIGFSKVAGAYDENSKSLNTHYKVKQAGTYHLVVDNTDYTGVRTSGNATVSIWIDIEREVLPGQPGTNTIYYNNKTIAGKGNALYDVVTWIIVGIVIGVQFIFYKNVDKKIKQSLAMVLKNQKIMDSHIPKVQQKRVK